MCLNKCKNWHKDLDRLNSLPPTIRLWNRALIYLPIMSSVIEQLLYQSALGVKSYKKVYSRKLQGHSTRKFDLSTTLKS